jgi:glycosyltransferase involved in cell wall biosynthesis
VSFYGREDLRDTFKKPERGSLHVQIGAAPISTVGNVVLEAMASGVPPIVSDRGGPREIVQDGVTGFVTKARHVPDLLAAIERLLESPELRGGMSVALSRVCRNVRLGSNLFGLLARRRGLGSARRRRKSSAGRRVTGGLKTGAL